MWWLFFVVFGKRTTNDDIYIYILTFPFYYDSCSLTSFFVWFGNFLFPFSIFLGFRYFLLFNCLVFIFTKQNVNTPSRQMYVTLIGQCVVCKRRNNDFIIYRIYCADITGNGLISFLTFDCKYYVSFLYVSSIILHIIKYSKIENGNGVCIKEITTRQ